MQKDLLSPAAAKSYVPSILRGASMVSRRRLESSPSPQVTAPEMMQFLNSATMEMFVEVLFGGRAGDISSEEYDEFCTAAVEGIGALGSLLREPLIERFANAVGYKTELMKRFTTNFDRTDQIARRVVESFLKRRDANQLTDEEKDSYGCCSRIAFASRMI